MHQSPRRCSTPQFRRSPRISAREEQCINEMKYACTELMYPALRGYNLTIQFQKNLFMVMNEHFKVQSDQNIFNSNWIRQFREEVQEKTGETFETGPEVQTVYVIVLDSEPKMLVYLILLKEGGFKTSFTVYKEACLNFQQKEEVSVSNDLINLLTEAASEYKIQPLFGKSNKLDVRHRLKLKLQYQSLQPNRKAKKVYTDSQTENESEPSVTRAKKIKIDHPLNKVPKSSATNLLSEVVNADENPTKDKQNNELFVCTTPKDCTLSSPAGGVQTMDTGIGCGMSPEDLNSLDVDNLTTEDFASFIEHELEINGDISNNFDFDSNLDLQAVDDLFPETLMSQINDVLAVKPLNVDAATQTEDSQSEPFQAQNFVEDSEENSSLSTEVIENSMVEDDSNNLSEEEDDPDDETPLDLSVKGRDDVCMWDVFPLGQRQLVQVKRTSIGPQIN